MDKIELTLEDVEVILEKHKAFFNTQETKSIDFRIEQLKKLKCGIKKYESRILEALKKDLRKNEVEAYITEVGFVYNSIEEAIKNLKRWAKPKKVKTPVVLMPAKSFIISEPYGTVLIIGPYNYPFQLIIEPLIGVIAAGNCAVLKPSDMSPNVSSVIMQLIGDTFENRYVSCVEGSIETNTALINSHFEYIFFTGSIAVGKIIMEAAAKNLVPVTLELGGKSPVIVDGSADIKLAAKKIIWGKTVNAGQTCVAPDYVVVHNSIKDKLIKEMEMSIKEFFGTDIQKSESLGRIINDKHFNRLKNILEKDKEQIIYGGKYDEIEKYIEPTIVEVSSWDAASMGEEIFGPILPIMTYINLDKVINDIKKQPKPLALYLFTTNKNVENKVLSQISSGGVCINETITHLANSALPFGGVGNSGIGSYHGEQSFITFSHRKSVLKKSNRFVNKMLFPPYNEKQLNLIKKFFK
ncbi:aldehyde dehydrogenase [Clostridium lundense]|uniref:aldehyde dehydrogenase n=1 Tax=Clostridium lundense TaxID=319475 RepID=UPI000482FE25|nr:aldehyde dehydrogenase [Clostridium lundense]